MQRYSAGAIALHWLLALALAFQLSLGFVIQPDAAGFALYQLHKSVGITILLLSFVRLGWRLAHRAPPPLEKGWENVLAQAVHVGFYLFMILAPLTGWALVSTAPIEVPTLLFGTIPWPHLPLPDAWYDGAEAAHTVLAWFGLALFVLHVAGALRHHLLLRDGLLRRMAPRGSAPLVVGLAALVLLTGGGTLVLLDRGEQAGPQGEQAEAPAQIALADPELPPEEAGEAPDEAEADEAPEAEEEAEPEPEAAAEAGPPPIWAIQPGGRLAFSVGNGDSTIDGSFAEWSGAIRFDPDNPESAEISIDIDLASASVGDSTQDGMLRGAEFFAVASGPTATWRATSVRAQGGGRYLAQGTLSLKGASRAQAVNFTLTGEGLRRRVDGTATIDRNAFGIGGSSATAVAPNVSLTFGFDAVGRQP